MEIKNLRLEFDFTDFAEAEQKAFLNKFERYREHVDSDE